MSSALRTCSKCSLLVLASLLSSCGGGGGDGGGAGDGGGGTGNNYPLTLSMRPASLSATLVQGVPGLLTLDAEVTGTVSTGGTVYVVIDDTSGVLQADKVQITQFSSTSYMAQVLTSPTLATGEATGSISLKVCSDLSCTKIYGQTSVPYDFVVDSSTNTTPIAALAGASDWATAGGTVSQANYAPVTLNASAFTVRWLQTNMESLIPGALIVGASSLVTDSADRMAIMGVAPSFNFDTNTASHGGLIGFSESDGTPVWHETLADSGGSQQDAGPVAIANGIVYGTQGPHIGGPNGDITFTGLSATSGAVLFQTQISDTFGYDQLNSTNKGCSPGSPVVYGSTVFVNPGCIPAQSGAIPLAAFDAATGQPLWTAGPQGANVGTTIASDGSNLYYTAPNTAGTPNLTALDQPSGTLHWQATLPDGAGRYQYMTPTLDGTGGTIIAASTSSGALISRYDLTSGQLTWQSMIPAAGLGGVQALAVGNGMIYAGYGDHLPGGRVTVSALNVADGSTAWSWYAPTSTDSFGTGINAVIATNNLLFVCTDIGVYAVDLSTHATAWTLAVPGFGMAISPSGILYVITAAGYSFQSGSYFPTNQALLAVNLH